MFSSKAEALSIKFVNKSGRTIVQMWQSPNGTSSWQSEILQGRVIRNGGTWTTNFTARNPPRYWDFKFILQGGGVRTKFNLDIYRYTILNVT